MSAPLTTPQKIGAQYDEAVLRALSEAQNGGVSSLPPSFDVDGKPDGFLSPYPIDLTGYAAALATALDGLKTSLKAQVDAKAEALRLTLITPGSGQAMEYQEAYAEAVQVDGAVKANAGATFDPAAFPMLAASLGFDIDPQTGKASTDIAGEARAVLSAYDAYQKAGAAIRNVRLKGKAAIDAATDAASASAAFAAIDWPKLT